MPPGRWGRGLGAPSGVSPLKFAPELTLERAVCPSRGLRMPSVSGAADRAHTRRRWNEWALVGAKWGGTTGELRPRPWGRGRLSFWMLEAEGWILCSKGVRADARSIGTDRTGCPGCA